MANVTCREPAGLIKSKLGVEHTRQIYIKRRRGGPDDLDFIFFFLDDVGVEEGSASSGLDLISSSLFYVKR